MLFSGMDMYSRRFNRRYRCKPADDMRPEDFPGLCAQGCAFFSDRGQKLTGSWYTRAGQSAKAVLVLVQGLCGGHRYYLDICDAFARSGFLVFAYDATGNGESEGEAVGGFPQGVADLDYALRYVKAQEACRDLPIVLFGHSWGAYSACAALAFHPDVRAAIAVSGFDTSLGMLAQAAREKLGRATDWVVPLFAVKEMLRWGRYARAGAIKGFIKSRAKVMVIHSEDDQTVHMDSGYARYKKKFGDSPRFRFIRLEGRGHGHPLHENGVPGTLDAALMEKILDFAHGAVRQSDEQPAPSDL